MEIPYIICREVNKTTGEVAVYKVNADANECGILQKLMIRSRMNEGLMYFLVSGEYWNDINKVIVEVISNLNCKSHPFLKKVIVEVA